MSVMTAHILKLRIYQKQKNLILYFRRVIRFVARELPFHMRRSIQEWTEFCGRQPLKNLKGSGYDCLNKIEIQVNEIYEIIVNNQGIPDYRHKADGGCK